MEVKTTVDFMEWVDAAGSKRWSLVDERLDRIRNFDYFGDMKGLGGGLFELRWKNGLRVYFAFVALGRARTALMLMGGAKDGQKRDIKKARRILAVSRL